MLLAQIRFTLQPDFTLNISNLCCYELKKKIAKKYEKDNIRPIAILGLMQNEGGAKKEPYRLRNIWQQR